MMARARDRIEGAVRALLLAALGFVAAACAASDEDVDAAVDAALDFGHSAADAPDPYCAAVTPPMDLVEMACTEFPSGYCFGTVAPPFF